MAETYRSILPVDAIQIRECADEEYIESVIKFLEEHPFEDWDGDNCGVSFVGADGEWRTCPNGGWLVWFSGAREPVVMTDSAFSLNFRRTTP